MGKQKEQEGPRTRNREKKQQSRLASSALDDVAPAKKQKRYNFDSNFAFKLPFFKNKVKQLITDLEKTSPSDFEDIRKLVETIIAFLKGIKQEERNAATTFVVEEFTKALLHTSRAMFATAFTEILQNLSQITFAELKDVYTRVLNGSNEATNAAKVYFALCVTHSGRNTLEAAEFFYAQISEIAKSKLFGGFAISAMSAIANKISYDKSSKKLIQQYLAPLIPQKIEEYALHHFEAAQATSAVPSEDEKYVTTLADALIKYETNHFLPGVHNLWKQLLKGLSALSAAIVEKCWASVNQFFFNSREIEHPFQINCVSLGFEIITLALPLLQPQHLSSVITHDFLWHLSFCLTRDKNLQKPDMMRKPKQGSNMPYILKVPQEILCPVTHSAASVDAFIDAVISQAEKNVEFATVFYKLLNKALEEENLANIKQLSTRVQQVAAASADSFKAVLDGVTGKKPSEFINLVPTTFNALKKIDKNKLFEMLTILFANAFFKPRNKGDRGKKDDIIMFDDIPLALKTQFAIRFFKVLDTLTRKEVEYYENKESKKNLMYPWSERFATLYMEDFMNHETLVPINALNNEAVATRNKLVELSDKIAKLNKTALDVVGMQILLFRMILFQLYDPATVDESTVDDLESYIDAVYFNKKYDEVNPIETLTEVLLYLFRESNLFVEISTFTLLYRKLELTPAALDSIFAVIKNCVKPVKVPSKKNAAKNQLEGTEKLVSNHLRDLFADKNSAMDEDLDDDAMFELDEKIAQTVRQSLKLNPVKHSSETYAQAYRVIDLVQALYLLNPKKTASIVEDKRYKLMIFSRLVELTFCIEKQKGKFSHEQQTFIDRIESVVEGAQQEKYCRFIVPQMGEVPANKLSNAEYKEPAIGDKDEHLVLTRDLIDDITEKVELLIEVISTRPRDRRNAKLSTRIFTRSFTFFLKVLYFQPGTELAKQAVEALKRVILSFDTNTGLLNANEYMIPDVLDFIVDHFLSLKREDPREYKYMVLRHFTVLLPLVIKNKRILLLHKSNRISPLLSKLTEIMKETNQIAYSRYVEKKNQNAAVKNVMKKAFYHVLSALESFLVPLLGDIERNYAQTIKLDQQVMIKLVQEMLRCSEVMGLMKKGSNEARKMHKDMKHHAATTKNLLRVQNVGDVAFFKELSQALPLPTVLSAEEMSKIEGISAEDEEEGGENETKSNGNNAKKGGASKDGDDDDEDDDDDDMDD